MSAPSREDVLKLCDCLPDIQEAKGCFFNNDEEHVPAGHDAGAGMSAPAKEDVLKLRDCLRRIQEAKGCFFNNDEEHVLAVLGQLMLRKANLGYMACPCRFANGKYDLDKDIVCPCEYRADDMKEFGACYCNLYVTEAWNRGEVPKEMVPERRPPEMIIF